MSKSQSLLCMLFCLTAMSMSSMSTAYTFFNPFVKVVRYNYPSYYTDNPSNYVSRLPLTYYPSYGQPLRDSQISQFDSHLNTLPTINILAANPYNIDNTFTVVPMLVVSSENLNMITTGHIVSVSKKKPLVTIKTSNKDTIQCTPAVRIVLETPITVYNLKTSILFPSRMSILHENIRVPIRVGAVIVPVDQDVGVNEESPLSATIVYAIPTKPMEVDIDYVNNDKDYVNNDKDVIIDNNAQSVIVENGEGTTPVVAEADDSELVNRNPPVIPAGIVQSTQPAQPHLEVFQNPKESPVLIDLREESKKRI